MAQPVMPGTIAFQSSITTTPSTATMAMTKNGMRKRFFERIFLQA